MNWSEGWEPYPGAAYERKKGSHLGRAMMPIPRLPKAADEAVEFVKEDAFDVLVAKFGKHFSTIRREDPEWAPPRRLSALTDLFAECSKAVAECLAKEYGSLFQHRRDYRDFLKFKLAGLVRAELMPERILTRMSEGQIDELSGEWLTPDGLFEQAMMAGWGRAQSLMTGQNPLQDLELHPDQFILRRPVLSYSITVRMRDVVDEGRPAFERVYFQDQPSLPEADLHDPPSDDPQPFDGSEMESDQKTVQDPVKQERHDLYDECVLVCRNAGIKVTATLLGKKAGFKERSMIEKWKANNKLSDGHDRAIRRAIETLKAQARQKHT